MKVLMMIAVAAVMLAGFGAHADCPLTKLNHEESWTDVPVKGQSGAPAPDVTVTPTSTSH